jgi:hypothetical protein
MSTDPIEKIRAKESITKTRKHETKTSKSTADERRSDPSRQREKSAHESTNKNQKTSRGKKKIDFEIFIGVHRRSSAVPYFPRRSRLAPLSLPASLADR